MDDDTVVELDNDTSNIHDNSQIGLNQYGKPSKTKGLKDFDMEVETPHSRNYEGGSDEEAKDSNNNE